MARGGNNSFPWCARLKSQSQASKEGGGSSRRLFGCCGSVTDVPMVADWDMLPPDQQGPPRSLSTQQKGFQTTTQSDWEGRTETPYRPATPPPRGRPKGSPTVPQPIMWLCCLVFLGLVGCLGLLAWPNGGSSGRGQVPAEEVTLPPTTTGPLEVEIGLPRFEHLLAERYADHASAWHALAGEKSSVEFAQFKSFSTELAAHLNSTQSWWVFSLLDTNQDFELKEGEFYERLAGSSHLLPT